MTVWVNGNIITAAWMNQVESILSSSTYATDRTTDTPNTTFDISGVVALNHRLNGSITVGSGQYYEWMGARQLTSTLNAGAGYAAVLGFDHRTNIASGAGGYGVIGSVTGVTGAGKISVIYGRAVSESGFTGSLVAGTFSVTAGAAHAGTDTIMDVEYDATGAYTIPTGIYVRSNSPGTGAIGSVFAIQGTVSVAASAYMWSQRSGTTADFLSEWDPSNNKVFSVDYLGNIIWLADATPLALGARIKGDFTNATFAKRTMFQTGQANSNTTIGILPSGSAVVGGIALYNTNDPDNAGRLQIQSGSAAHVINCTSKGTGTNLALGVQFAGVTKMMVNSNGLLAGINTIATNSTSGFPYIPAAAGAPTGVPGSESGMVAMYYDTTNHKIWFYDTNTVSWRGVAVT